MKSAWEVAADMLDPQDDSWVPEEHQIPPVGNWFTWLLLGGRGAGKTAASARYIHDHISGPPCLPGVPGGHWVGIIGPTLGDAVTSCVYGPSGLRAHDPGVRVRQTVGGATVKWTNGAEAKLFGAHTPEDVERLRSGGNRCIVWAEELAAWRYMEECWQHMRYGLRVGPRPHVVASTTPKNRPLIKELIKKAEKPNSDTVITRATTADNPHLDTNVKDMLFEDYGGTRLGRQELYAELLEDVEGALWKAIWIDNNRLKMDQTPHRLDKMVVGVDPPATAVGAECGIVVAGVNHLWVPEFRAANEQRTSHGFVFADESLQGSPETWAKKAVKAFYDYDADYVVAEINNGGDMVPATIRSVDRDVPVKVVRATRGKARRAEPVVSKYEQGRVHHIGNFGQLEDQQTGWDPEDADNMPSPDRMDALVWALSELMVLGQRSRMRNTRDSRLNNRR